MVCLLEILLCFIHIFLWVHFCSCCCTICHLLFVKLLLCVHVQISTVFTIRSIRFLFCYLPHLFFAFHQWSFCWPTFCAMCGCFIQCILFAYQNAWNMCEFVYGRNSFGWNIYGGFVPIWANLLATFWPGIYHA